MVICWLSLVATALKDAFTFFLTLAPLPIPNIAFRDSTSHRKRIHVFARGECGARLKCQVSQSAFTQVQSVCLATTKCSETSQGHPAHTHICARPRPSLCIQVSIPGSPCTYPVSPDSSNNPGAHLCAKPSGIWRAVSTYCT